MPATAISTCLRSRFHTLIPMINFQILMPSVSNSKNVRDSGQKHKQSFPASNNSAHSMHAGGKINRSLYVVSRETTQRLLARTKARNKPGRGLEHHVHEQHVG